MIIWIDNRHVAALLEAVEGIPVSELTPTETDAVRALDQSMRAEMKNHPYQMYLRERAQERGK